MSPTQFLLLLHSVPHLGEKALARLLRLAAQQRLTPDKFLAMSRDELQDRCELHPDAAQALEQERDLLVARSAESARSLRAHGVHLLSVESATYPTRLIRNEDAPPPLLYAHGTLAPLDYDYAAERFTFTLAVSNGADARSLDRLDALASELSAAGGIPVTGHDRAPYQRLALAAQRRGGPTIYVLDRGLREALGPQFDRPPFAAARIRDAAFDVARDLALSPFRLDDHGIGANNRKRDAIVFALSDVIVALDVRAGGEMADACVRAAGRNRPVFVAADGRDGCAALLARGCAPLPTGAARVSEIRDAVRNRKSRTGVS
jgi:predicted Rossmann fold nucleotide-binding protein DprA/Smf involved in DNA uptake